MERTHETIYINLTTKEATNMHDLAMKWYRQGDEVAVWSWSETLQEMVERCRMIH